MTGIQSNHLIARSTVTDIEVVRTYRVAFQTDTEHLRFDTIFHILIFGSENLIQRIFQQRTIFHSVYSDILASVMHPKVHDTWIALCLTHFFCNYTTTFGMFNPELTDTFIRIRKWQVTWFRMRERSRVEVKFHVMFFTPFYPTLEMFRFHLVTVYHLTLEISIDFMQVQTMSTRDIRSSFQDVSTQFVNITSFARIITSCLNASGQWTGLYFKSCNVISLPAVKWQMKILHSFQYFFGVYTYCCITFHSNFIRFLNQFFFFHDILLVLKMIILSIVLFISERNF